MLPKNIVKNQFYTPPRASNPTGTGQEIVFPVAPNTAGVINLTVVPVIQPYNASASQTQERTGVVGHYVTIYADGVDIGVIFGVSLASVSSGGAPVLSAYGVASATGGYTGATGTCHRIPAGNERRYLLQEGVDLYMGYVGASGPTGAIRMYQSDPPNL